MLDTICGFDYAYIRRELWGLRSTKMSIFFTGVVSCIEDSNTSDVNHKHSSTKDMASCVTPKSDAVHLNCLMKINNLYFNKIITVNKMLVGLESLLKQDMIALEHSGIKMSKQAIGFNRSVSNSSTH